MDNQELAKRLMNELCLDDVPENITTITTIVSEATAMILAAIDGNKTADDFKDNQLFILAVKTLATQIYYERTLPDGFSLGLLSIINALRGGVDDEDN